MYLLLYFIMAHPYLYIKFTKCNRGKRNFIIKMAKNFPHLINKKNRVKNTKKTSAGNNGLSSNGHSTSIISINGVIMKEITSDIKCNLNNKAILEGYYQMHERKINAQEKIDGMKRLSLSSINIDPNIRAASQLGVTKGHMENSKVHGARYANFKFHGNKKSTEINNKNSCKAENSVALKSKIINTVGEIKKEKPTKLIATKSQCLNFRSNKEKYLQYNTINPINPMKASKEIKNNKNINVTNVKSTTSAKLMEFAKNALNATSKIANIITDKFTIAAKLVATKLKGSLTKTNSEKTVNSNQIK